MSFTINPKLAWIFVVIVPFLAFLIISLMRFVMPFFRKIFKKYDALNESVQENVSGIRVVKAFVREDYETEKFKKAAGEVRDNFTRAEKVIALNGPIMTLFINFASILISAFAVYAIIDPNFWGAYPGFGEGQLSALISYGIQMLSCLMMFSMIFVMLSMSIEGGRRIAEVLKTESDIVSPENAVTEVKDGSIRFEDVRFKYSATANKYALDDIDLTIASGETVGILGGTGSSKTTLIQLIPRLYDATEGAVYVGGVNVKDYDLDVLRKEVAVVLQKNVLFSGTIKENLRWGDPEASDEELVRVCKLAQAHDFISAFSDGYAHEVSAGGTNLSGGQRQRVLISRAIAGNPEILILDDSSSALDYKTDANLRLALASALPHSTVITVAQRVSSVKGCDLILVIENGEIIGCGKHEALMEHCAEYREISDSQMGGAFLDE
jgi:ATP-binding cassette subfamily B protein